jgi:hypothetical protein
VLLQKLETPGLEEVLARKKKADDENRFVVQRRVCGATAGVWCNGGCVVQRRVYGATAGVWCNGGCMVQRRVYGATAGVWCNGGGGAAALHGAATDA